MHSFFVKPMKHTKLKKGVEKGKEKDRIGKK